MFEDLLDVYKTKAAESERELKESQAMVALVLAVENLSEELGNQQRNVEILGRLVERVDHLSKEVADLKSQIRTRQPRKAPLERVHDGNALDNHANTLIELMGERPGKYTTSEIIEMLGLNKTTVISAMKRAVELDPLHMKLTQGKRRKLYLAYTPEDNGRGEIVTTEMDADNEDKVRLKLMAMT
jgi:hypothetical protein